MNYDELIDFIENKMRMSHIYQPLAIKSLVESDGMATLRQLARSFLQQDESQIRYYEKRIREMPVKVLGNHGVLERDGQHVSLNVECRKLTFKERAKLTALCDQKIAQFLEDRGLATWDYRMLETDPVPDTVRFEVFRRAKAKCQACGVSAKDQPLHVDHIQPRSKGGRNDISNLQALCAPCNLAKSNRDNTDFRELNEVVPVEGCLFCNQEERGASIREQGAVLAIEDGTVANGGGGFFIVPIRHTEDFLEFTDVERQQCHELARTIAGEIRESDERVKGFDLGYRSGKELAHAHLHLVAKRD